MVIDKNKNTNPLNLKIRGIQIKGINEFNYLGGKINQDERWKRKIKSRIAQVKKIF